MGTESQRSETLEANVKRVYVASPHGFTEAGRLYLAQVLHPSLEAAGLEILDPWAGGGEIIGEALKETDPAKQLEALRAANEAVGQLNAELIAGADCVLAVLDGAEVDGGTASEVGYAAALGVPVVAVRSDFRQAGDNAASRVNLQIEYFVAANGGSMHTSLAGALEAIENLTRGRGAPAAKGGAAGDGYVLVKRDEALQALEQHLWDPMSGALEHLRELLSRGSE